MMSTDAALDAAGTDGHVSGGSGGMGGAGHGGANGDSGSGGIGGTEDAAVISGAGGTGSELDASVLGAAIENVAPRTVFVLEPTTVRVFGSRMREVDGAPVFVGDQQAGVLIAVGAKEGHVAVPGLEAGEHFLQVGAPAGAGRPGARLVATERIEYAETNLALPGIPRDVRYDAERRAFFGFFGVRLHRLRQEDDVWQLASVDLPSPSSFTITADGTELLVTNPNCVLAHVDPDSLVLRGTETLSACVFSALEAIDALADGTTLLLEPNAPSPMREYPSLEPFAAAPNLYSPMTLLSQHQTRLIMADAPTSSAEHGIYSYDVSTRVFDAFTTLDGDYFQPAIIAISGQGERFAHYDDIYDERLLYLGSLDAGDASPTTIALSGDGRVAVRFDFNAQTLRAYDISGAAGPFPPLAAAIPFARATYGSVSILHVDHAGEHVVVFSSREVDANTTDYHFVVRRIAP